MVLLNRSTGRNLNPEPHSQGTDQNLLNAAALWEWQVQLLFRQPQVLAVT